MGQMRAVLATQAPGIPVIDLFADLPMFEPQLAGCLLAAHIGALPEPCVILAVVDPGVGGDRHGMVLRLGQKWFVGPDNGLFRTVLAQQEEQEETPLTEIFRIPPAGPAASASFHGRDVFAPIAAKLARGDALPNSFQPIKAEMMVGTPETDLARVVYIDDYGNVMTGLRADKIEQSAQVCLVSAERPEQRLCPPLGWARTFGDRAPGEAFWYANSNGLMEVAVNKSAASTLFGAKIGDFVSVSN